MGRGGGVARELLEKPRVGTCSVVPKGVPFCN